MDRLELDPVKMDQLEPEPVKLESLEPVTMDWLRWQFD